MGIDDAYAASRLNVLPDAVLQKNGFAAAGIANDVHMLQPRLPPEERDRIASGVYLLTPSRWRCFEYRCVFALPDELRAVRPPPDLTLDPSARRPRPVGSEPFLPSDITAAPACPLALTVLTNPVAGLISVRPHLVPRQKSSRSFGRLANGAGGDVSATIVARPSLRGLREAASSAAVLDLKEDDVAAC